MTWTIEGVPDAEHEGWAAPLLNNGMLGVGSCGDGIMLGEKKGVALESDVVGFRAACVCGWVGELWSRVADPADVDEQRRLVATDTGFNDDLPDAATESMRGEWLTHVSPKAATANVRTAVGVCESAAADLDKAVLAARRVGASWADIGDAVGISRQSAHERWRTTHQDAIANEMRRDLRPRGYMLCPNASCGAQIPLTAGKGTCGNCGHDAA